MKINKLSFVVVLFLTLVITGSAFSAGPAKEPKEPLLEKEHKFESYDRKKMKKEKPAYSNSDDVKMSKNGRVISTGTELVFLDDMGNIVKRKPIKNGLITEFSPDGKRMSQNISKIIGEKGVEVSLFKMLDENGDLLWEEEDLAFMDGYWLSQADGGVVIVSACGEGGCGRDFKLYNVESQESKVINPDVDSGVRRGQFGMSDDGNYFAAGYYEYDPSVAFFDISGKQLWVKHLEKEKRELLTGPIGISPNGNFVLMITYAVKTDISYIYIYNKFGELLLKKDFMGCSGCKFGFELSEKFAVILGAGGYYIYDLANPKFIANIKHNLPNIIFQNIDVSDDVIAIVAQEYEDNAKEADLPRYLFIYNFSGELLHKKKIVGHGIKERAGNPQVKVIDNGRRILVRIGDKAQIYKNEFAK
ncbi:MAG: hypothetical protein OEV28_13760 [Nitrospirota bacterium]|nr:hypothetical protein [Nitrospirota bacterium]